jgi:N-acetylglucosamine-6-phosphate deacetylase
MAPDRAARERAGLDGVVVTLLTNARVVTPQGTLSPGWLRVTDAKIAEVGPGTPPGGSGAAQDLAGAWVIPGFIDLHVHGGEGASMAGEPNEILRAAAFHRRHGTTRLLASVGAAPFDEMLGAATAVANLLGDGERTVVGCHLEGPFLNHGRRGAQDPHSLLAPDEGMMRQLLDAGRGTVRVVTLAPELNGAPALVGQVLNAGAVAAIGHTDATYRQASESIRAGVRLATHLFNGMREVHHREPGPVIAALENSGVVCELINDGYHVDDAIIRLVFSVVGPRRVALVTDASPATGMGDGDYKFGAMTVRVVAGRAMLIDGSSLAGSTLTMDRAVRRAVKEVGLPIEDVVIASSATPAKVLGIDNWTGSIESGKEADLVVLDDDLSVMSVMASGIWVGP